MARKYEALALEPLPIRVKVCSAQKRIPDIGCVVTSKEDFDLYTIPLNYVQVFHSSYAPFEIILAVSQGSGRMGF